MTQTLLRKGDHSAAVGGWQQFLNKVGYSLTVDNRFGEMTDKATRGFQAAHGLRADGIVGPNTVAAAKAFGYIEPGEALRDGIILVSAGHTNIKGQDRGVGANGYVEGELSVVLRDAVAARLRELGRRVSEDGLDGVNDPLTKAIALARAADVAVEFHWNAGPTSATGIEVLCKSAKKALAQRIAAAVAATTGLTLRGEKGWKSDTSGAHSRLGFCDAGGLIVEICFITNASDMAAYHGNFGKVVEALASRLATE
jgi:N-acetylmuramoyl-L-alanine amidase